MLDSYIVKHRWSVLMKFEIYMFLPFFDYHKVLNISHAGQASDP
jgi:hypothetical protein